MRPNKWLEIQNRTNDCPKCTNLLAHCQCPKKQNSGGDNAPQNQAQMSENKAPQLESNSPALTLKPDDSFSLTFTPKAKNTEEKDEFSQQQKKDASKNGELYEALVPLEEIIQEFEKYLQQIALEQGTTVEELQKQGYGYEMQGNVLLLRFPNQAHGDTFCQMLLDKGMGRKVGPDAAPKSSALPQPKPEAAPKEEAPDDDVYQSPSPFKTGIPQLTR